MTPIKTNLCNNICLKKEKCSADICLEKDRSSTNIAKNFHRYDERSLVVQNSHWPMSDMNTAYNYDDSNKIPPCFLITFMHK